MREYDEIAEWYAALRDPEVGVSEVTALAERLASGARVLDLGCGTGVPVSKVLQEAGLALAALDSSAEMIARYRAAFPEVPAQCVRVQDARFAPGSFGAVVAWGVLFHLSERERAAAIASVAEWLAPGPSSPSPPSRAPQSARRRGLPPAPGPRARRRRCRRPSGPSGRRRR